MKRFTSFFVVCIALLLGVSSNAWGQETALSEGFESGDLTTKWTLQSCKSTTNRYSGVGHSGSYGFRFTYNSNPPQYLISNTLLSIPAGADEVAVSFWYKAYNASYTESFQVGYSTTTNASGSFTWLPEVSTNKTSWQQFTNSSLPVGTKYIAIKYTANNKYYLYIDDILVTYTTPTSCPKPTNFAASVGSSTSATLSWTRKGTETAWDLQYSDDNFATHAELNLTTSDVTVVGNNCSYTLTGLSPQTTYKMIVRANCGGGDGESDWTSTATVTTPCAEITVLPWEESFTSGTVSEVPMCWDNSASTSTGDNSDPYAVWTVYSYNSNKMIRMHNFRAKSGIALVNTPLITLPAAPAICELTFKYSHRADCGAFNLKISTNGGSSFTNLASYSKASGASNNATDPGTFTNVTIDLASYAGSTIMLQFFANANYGNGAIFVDDINVHAIASACPKPTALACTAISANSATFGWTAQGEETAWDLQYSDDNFTTYTELNLTTSEVTVVGDNCSYTLTGLSPLTTYNVKVRANCGGGDGESDWTSPVSFVTPCQEEDLPFYENFNCLTSGIPECWDNSQGDMASQNDSYRWNYFADDGNGGACVSFNSYNTSSGKYNFLYTKPVKVHEATTLTFRYKNPDGGDLSVYYSFDGGSTKTLLASGLTGASSWTERTCSIPAQASEKSLVVIFKGTSNYGSGDAYLYIDDIRVTRSSCSGKPTGLAASNIESNSADLAWTSSASEWKMRYRENCGDWIIIDDITSNSYALTGLNPITNYEVQVAAVCGVGEESAWSESAKFRTPCGPIVSLPWSYGFEGVSLSAIPECWSRTPDDTNIGAVSSQVRTGTRALKLYGGYTERTIILPEFAEPFNGLKIELYCKLDYENDSYGKLKIGYINTSGTFVTLQTVTPTATYAKAEYTYPAVYADTPSRIAIQFSGATSSSYDNRTLYIDDITISSVKDCSAPTGVTASAITSTTAHLSWTARGGISSYQYCVVARGASADWSGNLTTNTNSVDLTSLSASTNYDFYVRCVCGIDEYSDASAVCQFSTTATCPTPSGLNFSGLSYNGATVTWTAGGGETSWNLRYKAGSGAWTDDEGAATGLTSCTYALTGLDAGTTYTVEVQAACQPDWSTGVISSTYTPVCPQPGAISLTNEKYDRVTVGWAVGGTEDHWNLRYKETAAADIPANWTAVATNTDSHSGHVISGLTSGTEYTIEVSTACCAGAAVRTTTYRPLCPQPGDITLKNETYNSVMVDWNAGGTEDHWNLQYKAAGDANWTDVAMNTTTRYNHTISGLTAGVTYTISVTSACCEGGLARTTTYTPSCAQPGAITLFNKTYNSVTVRWNAGGTEDHWNLQYKVAADADIPANWTDVAMNTTSNTNHNITGLTSGVEYTIRVTTACCDALPREVNYTPVCAIPASATISNIRDVQASASWPSATVQYIVVPRDVVPDWNDATTVTAGSATLTGLTVATNYDFYVRTKCAEGNFSESLKRQFTTVAQTPTNIVIDELTSDGGTFSWSASTYGAETQYQWKTSAVGSDWSEPISVRTATVTGLDPNTTYTFYVRSYYSADVQSTAITSNFTTECGTYSIPWSYDFNSDNVGDGVPRCWSSTRSDYSEDPGGTYPKIVNYSGTNSSKCLSVYGGTNTGYMYVILPKFEVSLNDLLLTFYYRHYASWWLNDIDPQFSAGYFSTPGDPSTFVSLGGVERHDTHTKAEYNLAEVPVTVENIVIRYGGGTGGDIEAYIDDIEMRLSPSCSKPAIPTCTATTINSATITWTDFKPVDRWKIEYSRNEDYSESITLDVNEKPYTITGLSANTRYYARVRGVCDEDNLSDWSVASAIFRTECAPYSGSDMPYIYGFETNTETGSGNIPYCWTSNQYEYTDAYDETYIYPYVDDETGGRSGNYLKFYGGQPSNTLYITTLEFEDEMNDLYLEFYYKNASADVTSPQLTVGYLTTPGDNATFTLIQVLDRVESDYTKATIDLSGVPDGIHSVTFKWGDGIYEGHAYIDDITIGTAQFIFVDKTHDQLWTNPRNWTSARVPSIENDAFIRKPVIVDDEHAAAKSIVIDQYGTSTGKLTIPALKGLEVAGTITRTTNGANRLATGAEDLVLESSASGNASLIFNNSNGNSASVAMYSKGYIDYTDPEKPKGIKNYQYIGVPVSEANALYNYYGSWLYSWSDKGSGYGWQKVPTGGSVYAWTGYCITQETPKCYSISGTLVPTTYQDITVPAGENMVIGNSWTAPIDISTLNTETDMENLAGNIYFFNTGVDKTGDAGETGAGAGTRYAGSTYLTVPVNSAKYMADNHINSMQGFFVKNTSESEGTLHLNYESHVRGTTRGSIIGDAMHAPRRAVAESNDPVVLWLTVVGEHYDDRLLLLEREDFSYGFDNGWDGDKWDGNESVLYLYTLDSEGTENSVSAVPDLEGTVVGFRAGADNAYTMYFEYLNSDATLYLFDTETNSYTRIENGGSYWFTTQDREKHQRFIITRSNGLETPTGVDEVPSDKGQSTKARKLLINDKMYILLNGKLYDATGKAVR